MKINAGLKYQDANRAYLEYLQYTGWKVDGFGHAKKYSHAAGCVIRKKFMARKIRLEEQHEVNDKNCWVHVGDERYQDWIGEII